MKKKKLFRITTVPETLDNLLKNQLKFLNKYFDVTAISSDSSILRKVEIREGVSVIGINVRREISLFHDLKSLILFIILFTRKKPNIIHSNSPKASLLSMLAGYICNIKHRIYLVTGLRYETASGFKRKILILSEKLTCLFANKILAESIGVKAMLIDNKITKKEIFIIANGNINGIDTDYWNSENIDIKYINKLKKNLLISDGNYVFIYIGRIVKDKGINELVNAFDILSKSFTNVKLLILGSYEDKLDPISYNSQKIIEKNTCIKVLGFVEDIRPYLFLSNCLVLPSYREGFPNVILQAGAMGIPVIMTPVNGYHEYLRDINGGLINKNDSNSLYNLMYDHVNNIRIYNTELIRSYVVNKFSQTQFYDQLLEFYNKL